MTEHLLPLLALFTATAVAGCSATGTSTPEPFPADVSEDLAAGIEAEALHHDGTNVTPVSTVTVAMAEDGSTLSVEAEGTTYDFVSSGSSTVASSPGWTNPVNYTTYPFSSAAGLGAVVTGRYFALAAMSSGSGYYVMQGGLETPTDGLPDMLTEYEGGWSVTELGASSANGIFEAGADFDAGTIAFDIQDNTGASIGAGAGTISGNGFASSFNVTSGANLSTNNLDGNFYGPGAEDMAGLIDGSGASGETYGYVIGHQK